MKPVIIKLGVKKETKFTVGFDGKTQKFQAKLSANGYVVAENSNLTILLETIRNAAP